jgi:hypothetical protein
MYEHRDGAVDGHSHVRDWFCDELVVRLKAPRGVSSTLSTTEVLGWVLRTGGVASLPSRCTEPGGKPCVGLLVNSASPSQHKIEESKPAEAKPLLRNVGDHQCAA